MMKASRKFQIDGMDLKVRSCCSALRAKTALSCTSSSIKGHAFTNRETVYGLRSLYRLDLNQLTEKRKCLDMHPLY